MIESPAARPQSATPAELDLLLCCARTRIDARHASRIGDLIRGGIDWDALIRIASRHEVLPLLYRGLSATCPDAVPRATLGWLRDRFYANSGHNLSLTNELLKLLKLLGTRAIHAIPLKGPALAVSAYGQLALRQFGDVDVLVRERDVPESHNLLVANGYCPIDEPLSPDERISLRGGGFYPPYHAAYRANEGRTSVEVHWDIAPKSFSYPIDPSSFWARLGSIQLGPEVVPTFAPEDLVLILSVHGAKHFWEELKWIADFSELVQRHEGLDWGAILAEARSLGKERVVLLALQLAHEVLGLPLPDAAAPRVAADRMVLVLARQVRERLFLDDPGGPGGGFSRTSYYLGLSECRRDRVRHHVRSLRAALTPRDADRQFLPHPRFLPFIPYLVRPVRIVRDRLRRRPAPKPEG